MITYLILYGICRNIYSRINRGWNLEEALEIAPKPHNHARSRAVEINGINFNSQISAAKHFGINEGTWHKRQKLGWTMRQTAAIDPPPSSVTRRMSNII